jgi:poly(3-hydroxybutyrate) depolymerase
MVCRRSTTIAITFAVLCLAPHRALAWPPGDTTGIAIQFQSLTRHYNVHVPASYDGSNPVPLVLDFHGWMNDPSLQESLSGFQQLADATGFIVAYPEGYEGTGTQRSWNAGTCCPPATTDNIDDVGFARAVVADIESQANIDPLRVYATGLSNGGGMSHRLACEAADLFAAVSPVACPLLLDPFTLCQPVRPISVLHVAGLTDEVVPYNGGESQVFPGIFLPSSPDSFAYWVGTDGCGNGPPEIMEDLGNGASCDTHTACGAGVEVGFCSIHGTVFHGHVLYYNAEAMNVAQRAWQFMSQFTLPPGITTTTSTTTTSTTTTSTINSTTTTTLLPSCPPVPASGCQPALSQKALLKLGKGTTPDKNKLGWKWVSSATVVTGDFGDPTAGTGYALCVYGPGGRVMAAMAPAGGTCSGKPCWALVRTGAKYTNKTLTPDGLLKISLKAGGGGQAKIGVKGKGAKLLVPAFPLGMPVHVQLRREDTGACWDTVFSNALVNTAAAFKGKSD